MANAFGITDAQISQASLNQQPIDPNNPWADPTNTAALSKNSSYLPENYTVGGATKVNAYDGTPADWTPKTPSMPTNGSYPAMANSYGLGGQPAQPQAQTQAQTQAPVQGNTSDPNFAVKALSQAVNDSGSKGFNPWSMQGEANVRN